MEKKLSLEQLEEIKPICIFDNRTKFPKEYTIVIPTYCRPALLQYALKSALDQVEFESYEIIVLDNNPARNDETEIFMAQFSKIDRLSYFKQPNNVGGCANWNKVTQMARTEWVIMLHDDDMLYPDFLHVLEKARQAKLYADAIYSANINHEFSDGELPTRSKKQPKLWQIKERDFMISNIAGPMVGMAFRKKAWEKIGGWDLDYAPMSDYFFNSQMAHQGKVYKIKYYPTTCCRWCDNDTNRPGVREAMLEQEYIIRSHIMQSTKSCLPTKWQRMISSYLVYKITQKYNIDIKKFSKPSPIIEKFIIPWESYISFLMKVRRKISAEFL